MADVQGSPATAKGQQSPGMFLEQCLWALIDARDDAALSALCKKILAKVVALLRTDGTRSKALEVIKSLTPRIKSAAGVRLPLQDLFRAFVAKEATPFEKNFAMVFLEMGWKRGSPEELGALIPEVLQHLSSCAEQQQQAFLQMVLYGIEHVKSWSEVELPAAGSEILRSFLLDVLLYSAASSKAKASESAEAVYVPPGLSSEALNRLTTKIQGAGTPAEYLQGRKIPVLKAVQASLFSDEAALPLTIVASCGAHHEVRKIGEEVLKVRTQKISYEDPGLVQVLYTLFLGEAKQGDKPATRKRSAAEMPVRASILTFLCRSIAAANSFPFAVQAIFEGIYGEDSNVRIKQGAMQLASWTLKNARDAILKPIAGVMLSGLMKFISTPPEIDGGQQAILQLRGFTYSAVGQLAQRAPEHFAADVNIATILFGMLISEPPEVKVSVQEALSMCWSAYRDSNETTKEKLIGLLQESVAQNAHQARFCAVYWANRLFPYSEVRARHICLLACADNKVEVRDEAERGLHLPKEAKTPYSLVPEQEEGIKQFVAGARLPIFEEMMDYISTPDMIQARRSQNTAVKAATVTFCNRCLANSCTKEGGITKREYLDAKGGERKTNSAKQFNDLIENALSSALTHGGTKSVGDTALARACFVALLDLFSARPDVVVGEYGKRMQWLETFLFCSNAETRELVASIYGELAATMESAAAQEILKELRASADTSMPPDKRIGALLAIGYMMHSMLASGPLEESVRDDVFFELYTSLQDKRTEVVCAGCKALALVGLGNKLPLPVGTAKETVEEGASGEKSPDSASKGSLTILNLIDKLGEIASGKEKENKSHEAAAHALGAICVSNRDELVMQASIKHLFGTAKIIRVEEFHFAVGEALACCGGGKANTSPGLLCQLKLPSVYEDTTKDQEKAMSQWARSGDTEMEIKDVLGEIMRKVMEETLVDGKHQVRAAGSSWLLCILRYNADHPVVQARLSLIQQHFTFLLGEKSDFTQEIASKGLGLVYEMCTDENMKEELVATLAKALMSGGIQDPNKKKDDDEKLFEEGTIKIDDKALGDGSLTTYKELCTVATELGQPELVYRFMNMAGHQQIWNSKRGAAFGFSTIASQAADKLKPHLPTLIPKLYRYQFDPNPKIQEAMTNLWESVIPDASKAKDEYINEIFNELLPGVGSRLWRVREASCLALADLLTGKRFEQVEKYLVELYRMSLRAIDDVKETVRKAGEILNRTVSGLAIRLADPTQSGDKVAQTTLGLILPFLMDEGIASSAAEVRVASITQLVKITKHAGASLRPYIPDLSIVLLESLSSLEPQMNTYLQLNADKYEISGETLERARVSASRNSPLADTLDLCLRTINEEAAEATVPRLVSVIRQGVGLPTRAGVAKFVSQLASMPAAATVVKKHSGKLLKALAQALNDRSAVIRQAMAGAAARVVAVAKETAIDEFVSSLKTVYKNDGMEDADARVVVAMALKEIVTTAADAARDFYPQILPLAFLGKEDVDEKAKELFGQVWDEAAGSTAAGVRIYGKELALSITENLTAESWHFRRMAARGASTWVKAIGSGSLGPDALLLIEPLRSCVAGRIWEGKEAVLEALAALASAREVDQEGDLSLVSLAMLIIGEAGKKRKEYRSGALKALTTMLEKKKDLDVADALHAAVQDVFVDEKEASVPSGPSAGRDADEEAHYETRMEERSREELRQLAVRTIAAGWPSTGASRSQLSERTWKILEPMLMHGTPGERMASIEFCEAFTLRLKGHGGMAVDGENAGDIFLAPRLLDGLISCMSMGGAQYKQQRVAAVKACEAVTRLCTDTTQRCQPQLAGCLSEERRARILGIASELSKEDTDMNLKATHPNRSRG